MNKRIDFTNLGGFPLDEDMLDFMQQSYRSNLSAIATMVGDKVILPGGVVVDSGNISDGWIVYNGEFIPFIGGPVAAQVVITEMPTSASFEDDNIYEVQFVKTATCGIVGDFDFSELVRLENIINVWLAGDLKQKYVDNAYIVANFDSDGYGINRETGWRIFSKAVSASAGKVLVNRDTTDPDFATAGNTGGEKTHTLTTAEIPAHDHDSNAGGGPIMDMKVITTGTADITGGTKFKQVASLKTGNSGGGTAHNNLQPYFVVLTLIKL